MNKEGPTTSLSAQWLKRGVIAMLLLTAAFSLSLSSPASAISQYHTVTFAENDSGSDSVTAQQTEDAPTALTLFSNLSPQFVDPGYSFVDWNTAPDGSGTSYSDGETYGFDSATVLYAIWVGEYHTVTFAENDTGSDSVTTQQTENAPTPITSFSSLSPAFVNSGYTFTGWNTEANGTGTEYTDGETYNFSAPLVLYAMWQAVDATATFNINGGTGSIAPETVSVGTSVSLPSSTGISETGYSFNGWNTAVNGSGTSYQAGASVTLSANETFYAQWTPSIQISFSDNGGVGSISALSGQSGSAVTLPGPTSLSNTGFTLTSWNAAANGSGTSYSPGQSLTLSSSMTLYAQWTVVASTTVSFSANGGSGSLTTLSGAVGATVTLPSSSSVVRSGYTLTSWNTAANGSGTSYSPGQSVTLSTSLTLYAQWKATLSSKLYGSIGVFPKSTTALSASLKAKVARLASVVKEKGYDEVTLFGYSADTGLASLNGSLSSARAHGVASYLESELRTMKVTGVKITATGEGAVAGKTSSSYSCVEVFVQ